MRALHARQGGTGRTAAPPRRTPRGPGCAQGRRAGASGQTRTRTGRGPGSLTLARTPTGEIVSFTNDPRRCAAAGFFAFRPMGCYLAAGRPFPGAPPLLTVLGVRDARTGGACEETAGAIISAPPARLEPSAATQR